MPDRAVLLMRQRDRALHGVGGNVATYREMKEDAKQPARWVRHPLAGQGGMKVGQGMTSLPQDVDDIACHASQEGHPEELHRRRASDPVAVNYDSGMSAR